MSHTPSKKKGGGKHHIKFAPTLFFEGVYQQAAFIFPLAPLCLLRNRQYTTTVVKCIACSKHTGDVIGRG